MANNEFKAVENNMITLKCTTCNISKPISEYYKKGTRDGVQRYRETCKECYKEFERRVGFDKCVRWSERNPKKVNAQRTLRDAVKKGNLFKPDYCTACGKSLPKNKILGHHSDYDKPLQVGWFCHQCHTDIHLFLTKRKLLTPQN